MSLRVRLADVLSGKRVWHAYREYRQSETWDDRRMEAAQVAKLRRVLTAARTYVPYYRRILDEAGVDPERIDSLAALESLPIIDKSTVRANHDAFRSRDPELKRVRAGQTGGTTGEPLVFYHDAETRSSIWGAFARFYDWMGVRPRDAKLMVWGGRIVPRRPLARLAQGVKRILENTVEIDAFRIRPANVTEFARVFENHRPRFVRGYALALYELALLFRARGMTFPLKALSTTVEPLFESYRPVFREVFRCEAFDQYACGEVQSVAFECEAHEGLHVARERCIVELGADGEIILTDLDNRAFPFVRYRNGDRAEWAEGRCPCGRPGPRLRRILGRVGDVVVGTNGARLHPEFFTHLLNETRVAQRRSLSRYQVIQRRDGSIDWYLVTRDLSPGEERLLLAHLQRYLAETPVRLHAVSAIPRAGSGKHRYVMAE